MSFFDDEDFEELDLDDEIMAITSSRSPNMLNSRLKSKEKKVQIPILNKTTADPNTFEYEVLLKQVNLSNARKIDSNFVKTPSPRSNARDTVQRLLFNHQLSENKKNFLRKQKEINEIKSCTFSPQIHNADRLLGIRSPKSKNRTIEGVRASEELKSSMHVPRLPSESSPIPGRIIKSSSQAKSHSQEHHITTSDLYTPRKFKIPTEGRPPIPRAK